VLVPDLLEEEVPVFFPALLVVLEGFLGDFDVFAMMLFYVFYDVIK
jgi:NADH:ubiquinone oxidoreductase subunit 4 (subunit M)